LNKYYLTKWRLPNIVAWGRFIWFRSIHLAAVAAQAGWGE